MRSQRSPSTRNLAAQAAPEFPQRGRRPSLFFGGVVLFAALYGAVVFHTFPPGDLASDRIFFREDYPLHFYDAASVSRILRDRGKIWGYDPYRMAGYPLGAVYSMDNKAAEVATALLGFLGPERAFKSFVLAAFLSFPFLLWSSARNLGSGRVEALLSLFLFLAFLCLDKIPIAFTAFGGFSFLLACFLALFLGSLLHRVLQAAAGDRAAVALFFAGALFFWVHVSAATVFAVPAAAVLLWERDRLTRRKILLLAAWAASVLAANGPWLALLLRFWHTKTPSQAFAYFSATGWPGLRADATDPLVWVRKPILLLAGFSLAGPVPLRIRVLGSSAVVFLLLSYFGDVLPMAEHLEPHRYVIPAFLCLCVPAAAGALRVARFVRERRVLPSLSFLLLFVGLGLPSLLGLSPSALYTLWDVRLSTRYDPNGMDLMRYLEAHTSRAGRILLEDAGYEAGGRQYYGSYLLSVLPYFIGREIVGGPQPDTPLTHHFADFTNGTLFRRPIEQYDEQRLRAYLDAYNIHWVVAWSGRSKRTLGSFGPEVLEKRADIDKFTVYRVAEPGSFFLQGSGEVEAGLDRIEIRNASAGEIVLKYHYVECLETEPALPLERVPVLDDPVGFLGFRNPTPGARILIRSGSVFRLEETRP